MYFLHDITPHFIYILPLQRYQFPILIINHSTTKCYLLNVFFHQTCPHISSYLEVIVKIMVVNNVSHVPHDSFRCTSTFFKCDFISYHENRFLPFNLSNIFASIRALLFNSSIIAKSASITLLILFIFFTFNSISIVGQTLLHFS